MKNTFKSLSLAVIGTAALTFGATGAAQAASVFDFTSEPTGFASPAGFNDGSLNLTVSGFIKGDDRAAGTPDDVSRFVATVNGKGLGVTKTKKVEEKRADGGDTSRKFDEFLTLAFNRSVRFVSASFSEFNKKGDVEFVAGGFSQTNDLASTISYGGTVGNSFRFVTNGKNDEFYLSSVTVEEVPTPALLPALLGMGAVAIRKRKSAVEESVEA